MRRRLAAALLTLAAAAYSFAQSDAKVVEMLTERAENPSFPGEKRAEAFVILASKQWQCSYDVTEQRENKWVEQRPDRLRIHYRMPSDRAAFDRARRCADEGLRLAERALALDPASPQGWSYKANLLREQAKLAEMRGDREGRAEYERLYEYGLEMHRRLTARPASERQIDPRLLSGKTVSKPQPAYPPEALAARAQGDVTVRVVVDEEGWVVEAEAVSGPRLLREASVAAARRARFSPTFVSGRPVKVSGLITYKFVLPKT